MDVKVIIGGLDRGSSNVNANLDTNKLDKTNNDTSMELNISVLDEANKTIKNKPQVCKFSLSWLLPTFNGVEHQK